eukprot:jgi/Chlat1/3870/Chrsp26S04166
MAAVALTAAALSCSYRSCHVAAGERLRPAQPPSSTCWRRRRRRWLWPSLQNGLTAAAAPAFRPVQARREGDRAGPSPSAAAAAAKEEEEEGQGRQPQGGAAGRPRRRPRQPRPPAAERVLGALLRGTSTPVGQYLAEPSSFLHRMDPRLKQAWLVALVVLPSRADLPIRIGVAVAVASLTVWALPPRVWRSQLGPLVLIIALLFFGTAFGSDGVPPVWQPRTPPAALEGLPELPKTGYQYVLFTFGPLLVTRRGLSFAASTSALSFTVLQSATLCLATTTSESLAASLRWFMRPLQLVGVPVDELSLVLLLGLRFTALVFEQVRSIVLGAVSRGVDWKALSPLETADVLVSLGARLFSNLFADAENIAQAMVARGFKGAKQHNVHLLVRFKLSFIDYLSLMLLVAFTLATVGVPQLPHL